MSNTETTKSQNLVAAVELALPLLAYLAGAFAPDESFDAEFGPKMPAIYAQVRDALTEFKNGHV